MALTSRFRSFSPKLVQHLHRHADSDVTGRPTKFPSSSTRAYSALRLAPRQGLSSMPPPRDEVPAPRFLEEVHRHAAEGREPRPHRPPSGAQAQSVEVERVPLVEELSTKPGASEGALAPVIDVGIEELREELVVVCVVGAPEPPAGGSVGAVDVGNAAEVDAAGPSAGRRPPVEGQADRDVLVAGVGAVCPARDVVERDPAGEVPLGRAVSAGACG